MSGTTKIEWADAVWNPITGCTQISPGCANCYAERMATRLAGRHGYPADDPFRVALHPERLDEPTHWRKPRRIFVCSMSDLFHEDVPDRFIAEVFGVMALPECARHTFMVLTKRPERMRRFMRAAAQLPTAWPWPCPETVLANVWLGVSVEDQARADERIPLLLDTPAAVRFVSAEPLLGPVLLWDYLRAIKTGHVPRGPHGPDGRCPTPCFDDHRWCGCGIDWVIAGGESGPGARPSHPDWFRSLRDQCQAAGVPFFFKQWGEWAPNCLCDTKRPHRTTPRPEPGKLGCMFRCGKKAAGRELDGRTWDQMPEQGGPR